MRFKERPSQLRFVDHDQPMVAPDFDANNMHPNDEPFWCISSPYDSDQVAPFLLDRAGMMELQKQLQVALARYYEKFPLEVQETKAELMKPGGLKEKHEVQGTAPTPIQGQSGGGEVRPRLG